LEDAELEGDFDAALAQLLDADASGKDEKDAGPDDGDDSGGPAAPSA
jgi:hypothetical protein